MYMYNFFFLIGCPGVGGCPSPGACWAYPRVGPVFHSRLLLFYGVTMLVPLLLHPTRSSLHAQNTSILTIILFAKKWLTVTCLSASSPLVTSVLMFLQKVSSLLSSNYCVISFWLVLVPSACGGAVKEISLQHT